MTDLAAIKDGIMALVEHPDCLCNGASNRSPTISRAEVLALLADTPSVEPGGLRDDWYAGPPSVGPRLTLAEKDELARMALDEDTAVSLVEWVEHRLRPSVEPTPETTE